MSLSKVKMYLWDVPRGIIYFNFLAKFFTGFLIALMEYSIVNLFDLMKGVLASLFIIYSVYSWNAYCDLERDKLVPEKSKRALPSRKVDKDVVLYLIAVSFISGLFLAFFINISFFVLTVLVLLLGFVYSATRRHYSFVTLLFFFASGMFSYLFGYVIVSQQISLGFLFFIVLQGIFYSSHVHIKDLTDVQGDKKLGDMTIPIVSSEYAVKQISFIGEIFYTIVLFLGILFTGGVAYLYILFFNILNFYLIQRDLSRGDYISAYGDVFMKVTYTTFALIFFLWLFSVR